MGWGWVGGEEVSFDGAMVRHKPLTGSGACCLDLLLLYVVPSPEKWPGKHAVALCCSVSTFAVASLLGGGARKSAQAFRREASKVLERSKRPTMNDAEAEEAGGWLI